MSSSSSVDVIASADPAGGSVSVASLEPATAPPPPVKRRKLRLSPKEKERRSKHIANFQHLATAASAARPPEERQRTAAAGGKGLLDRYRAMKAASVPDTPEGFRLRRKELEGKRDWLLDKLIECAETETKLEALSELRAALTEIRAEIPILLDREERAAKAATATAAAIPRAAIGPAASSSVAAMPADSTGNPSTGNPPADIPPVMAAD